MTETNFIITGTDTGIGKTVFSAMLMGALHRAGRCASYWKPIQSGLEDTIDTRAVQLYSDLADEYFLPEAYVLTEPLSPHRAAEIDGVEIALDKLDKPASDHGLIIEGAGGLMVPLSRTKKQLYINQFKRWGDPVILCARASLGTINHTLLSLEALWARNIPVHGLVFIGASNPDNIQTIADLSGVRVLGHMPWLDELSPQILQDHFDQNFKIEDFLS